MLYIHSPAFFDERALTVMGMSAKVTNNAIGRFGTGLKYAVAVTLRLGGTLRIRRKSAPDITFSTSPDEFRGKAFQAIQMHIGEQTILLPFTLDYGQNWEPWMVYREIVSNAYDEKGDVAFSPVDAETVIELFGLDIRHEDAFLPKDLQLRVATPLIEIYESPSSYIYYRGIRVNRVESMEATINILTSVNLSEERLMGNGMVFSVIIDDLLQHATFTECEKIIPVIEPLKSWFHPAPNRWSITGKLYAEHRSCPTSISGPYYDWKRSQLDYNPISLSEKELRKVHEALSLIARLAPLLSFNDLTFCENLGRALGCVYNNNIYIARRAVLEGRDSLAATLYEEYLHKFRGLGDECREMQEHLLKTIIAQL